MLSRGEQSRVQIIDNALMLFSQKGYHQTSIQEIADCCNISQTTVLYHFKSKKNLFKSILDLSIKSNRAYLARFISKESAAIEILKVTLKANVEWAMVYPEQAKVLLLLFYFSSTDTKLKALTEEIINGGRELVLTALVNLDKDENISSLLSLRELCVVIQQYVSSVIFQILASDNKSETKENFDKSIDRFLNSLLYRKL